MNHAELSRDLALALGYFPESVSIEGPCALVFRNNGWALFDYRDPSVALAMVELLGDEGCWLRKTNAGWMLDGEWTSQFIYQSLPEAAARAVIALKGVKP